MMPRSMSAYAINGSTVSAEAFYAVACDPRQSVAVEACAGAGKTWMLMTRMVNALAAGAAADQLLAITFTKKAAGEIRERLQARLAEPEHAALKARLLAAGRGVQILTFHAWFAQLLGAAPLAVLQRLGLPLHYELLEDDSVLLPELELAFYAAINQDGLGEQGLQKGLRADFAALLAELGRSKVSDALKGLLSKRVEFELADQGGYLETSVQSAVELYPAYASALALGDSRKNSESPQTNADKAWLDARPAERTQLGLLARVLGRHHTPTIQGWGHQLEGGLTANDLALVQSALLTQKLEPRKLGKMKLADIPTELQTATSGSSGEALLLSCQAYLMEIRAVKHQHGCWLYQQRMTRLGRVWLSTFAQLKQARGWVDMSDLERAATTLLADPELSGALQERLDLQLRHVMIDEFQDTNPLQWQAMHAWLASYAGSGGGQSRPSLFIVGDPKQSIYRFRRAEPRVFAAAQAFMRSSFDAALLSCDHTRRNSPEVVAVVNAAMGAAVQAHEYAGEQGGFRPHTTASEALGAALRLPLIERRPAQAQDADSGHTVWRDSLSVAREDAELTLREQEAAQAAHWIAGHIQGENQGENQGGNQGGSAPSVMVLSRRHSSLGLMQTALQLCGVSATKQEKHFLADVPAVQDVLALLGALVSPQSDLDLARALKSPLFGWSDTQLMQLRMQQLAHTNPSTPWFECLPSELRVQLTRWQTWLHRLPPHDALQAMFDEGAVLEKYQAAMPIPMRLASHQALQALLWAALQEDGGRYLSAYGLLRALRAKTQTIKAPAVAQTHDGATASVQLLTIHGAKGLEADTVLLLDTDSAPRRANTMTTLVDWQPDQPAPHKFVFLKSESDPPQCAQTLLLEDIRAREVEEMNTLYVAMTRARNTLVISACASYAANPQSVWQRLSPLCEAVDVTVPSMPEERLGTPSPNGVAVGQASFSAAFTLPVFSDVAFPDTAFADTAAWSALLSTQEAQIGLALHRLLQWLPMRDDAVTEQDWLGHELQAVGREFQLTPEALTKAHNMAKAMANGAAAWLWDRQQVDWSANEYELVSNGRLLRLDRLVKHRNTQIWWVIDFKSAAWPDRSPELREQLSQYQVAVAQHWGVAPDRVKAAFVSGEGNWLVHNPIHL